MREITTVRELISSLGGLAQAAEVFAEKKPTVIQWQQRGRIPSAKYVRHSEILRARQISAAPGIWSFEQVRASA